MRRGKKGKKKPRISLNFYFEMLMAKHGNALVCALKLCFLLNLAKECILCYTIFKPAGVGDGCQPGIVVVVVVVQCLCKNMHNSSMACWSIHHDMSVNVALKGSN